MGAVTKRRGARYAERDGLRDNDNAQSFPQAILTRCDNALVLFAAGFLGRQDAVFIADAGLRATCVDTDTNLLGQMEALYPADWEFVAADAFDFTESTGRMWDIVSVDCPSNMFQECAALVGLWCEHAREAVVLGTGVGTFVVPPDGWIVSERRKRSDFVGGVFWDVLERRP